MTAKHSHSFRPVAAGLVDSWSYYVVDFYCDCGARKFEFAYRRGVPEPVGFK